MPRALMEIEISGAEQCADMLTNLAPRAARNIMRAAVQQIATNMAKEIKQNTPVLTGNLRKAVKAKRKKSHPDKPVSIVTFEQGKSSKNDGFYWRFVEFGTKHIMARPFVEPVRARTMMNISAIMREEFTKKLQKHLEREAARNV